MSSAPRLARAQSWEDPACLRALEPGPEDDALVCEPSGDDALDLAALGARTVTVVAPDPGARALVALKLAAARELPVQSVRSLLGLGHFGRRVWFYHYLRPGLDPATRAWFDAREADIRAGLAASGEVERAMATLRERVLPLALGADAIAALKEAGTPGARGEVLATRWSGLRWAAAAQVWLPRIARLAGAPAEGAVARLRDVLARMALDEAFAASWLLTGAWGDPEAAHPWLSAAGLAAAKPRLGALSLRPGDRLAALRHGAFDLVVLGRAPLDAATTTALAAALRPGGRALAWTAGDPPVVAPPLHVDTIASARLRAADRGIFPGAPWLVRRAR